jgi:hypothetical protein
MSKNTTVSLEEALNRFEIWKDERLKVRVSFWGGRELPGNFSPIRGSLLGEIIAVSPAGTVVVQGSDCNVEVDLRECRFECSDPRDPPAFGGDAFAAQFELALQAKLPGGELFIFLFHTRGN